MIMKYNIVYTTQFKCSVYSSFIAALTVTSYIIHYFYESVLFLYLFVLCLQFVVQTFLLNYHFQPLLSPLMENMMMMMMMTLFKLLIYWMILKHNNVTLNQIRN